MPEPVSSAFITVDVNGESYEREVEARKLLVHFLRDDLDLTGTHIGCDGQLRRLLGARRRAGREELHDARDPG